MAKFVNKATEKLTKLSDEQVVRLFDNVRKENDELGCILESLHSGIITVDNNWHILRINKAVKRFIPLREKNDPLWNVIDDEEISLFIKEVAETHNTNVSREFSVHYGEKNLFINVSVLPLLKDTCIAGSIIVVEDNTSKRQKDILLHRMENMKTLTNLAASVAHEIKNPLGAISIHIQLMAKAIKKARDKDGLLPDEKFVEKYIDVVNEEIDYLNRIVMDFLFAVRPVQANFILSDPDSLTERTASFFKPELESSNICIETDLSQENIRLLLDEKLFREVLVNLLQNARAALEGVPDAKIVLKSFVSKKNQMYVLTVADNGCGMDEDTCSHIFEPYYTTKANGTGLGLTTVYKVIKEFCGDISVHSQKNVGTVFTISIPLPQNNTMLLEDNK